MYKLRKSAFLKWYFEEGQPEIMGERVFDNLLSDSIFAITTEDLFLECRGIPKDICEGQEPCVWPAIREIVTQEEVELIND